MPILKSFPPVSDAAARILILGSMPGERSLSAHQYYAHPRNAFWPIMTRVLNLGDDAAYDERLAALIRAKIAVWDVLRSCIRPGSLDSSIEAESEKSNDFRRFFKRHPRIELICFNGGTAERLFQKHALPLLPERALRFIRLPSTSPAHASLSLEQKRIAWNAVLQKELSAVVSPAVSPL